MCQNLIEKIKKIPKIFARRYPKTKSYPCFRQMDLEGIMSTDQLEDIDKLGIIIKNLILILRD